MKEVYDYALYISITFVKNSYLESQRIFLHYTQCRDDEESKVFFCNFGGLPKQKQTSECLVYSTVTSYITQKHDFLFILSFSFRINNNICSSLKIRFL